MATWFRLFVPHQTRPKPQLIGQIHATKNPDFFLNQDNRLLPKTLFFSKTLLVPMKILANFYKATMNLLITPIYGITFAIKIQMSLNTVWTWWFCRFPMMMWRKIFIFFAPAIPCPPLSIPPWNLLYLFFNKTIILNLWCYIRQTPISPRNLLYPIKKTKTSVHKETKFIFPNFFLKMTPLWQMFLNRLSNPFWKTPQPDFVILLKVCHRFTKHQQQFLCQFAFKRWKNINSRLSVKFLIINPKSLGSWQELRQIQGREVKALGLFLAILQGWSQPWILFGCLTHKIGHLLNPQKISFILFIN